MYSELVIRNYRTLTATRFYEFFALFRGNDINLSIRPLSNFQGDLKIHFKDFTDS